MNEYPRQKLVELIARYGTALCDDPDRCGGLLRDHCPDCRMEINVLVAALKERVAVELLNASASMPMGQELANRASSAANAPTGRSSL